MMLGLGPDETWAISGESTNDLATRKDMNGFTTTISIVRVRPGCGWIFRGFFLGETSGSRYSEANVRRLMVTVSYLLLLLVINRNRD